MGSMHTGLEEHEDGMERLAKFYGERAKGQVGLIVTGGIGPNVEGGVGFGAAKMTNSAEAQKHKIITKAVHDEGGKICMQILHAGRYSYQPNNVSASAIQAPINPFKPRALSSEEVWKTIEDYANCAFFAKEAGYDGVEIMGSEGYFINQFIVKKTNHREDEWGGSYENRIKLPLEIVRQTRKKVGTDFIIIYRLSMLDLVEEGSTWEEVEILAKALEDAGVTIINTGIGWHEARVPTIGTVVPRAGFVWVTKRLMGKVSIPLVATNRINSPEIAEQVLQDGCADMVSMARPFLADENLVLKAIENRSDEINTCIACNQACLDHTFQLQVCSCLVNPRACHETVLNYTPAKQIKKIAVVGAGPAGLAAATVLAERGHYVDLYEAQGEIGGQFNMAKVIPGKEEYEETVRYYSKMIEKYGVHLFLNHRVSAEELIGEKYDEVIIASGAVPRQLNIKGIDHPSVLTYVDVLQHKHEVGHRVAIIGAGGIGFDVAEYLAHDHHVASPSMETAAYMQEWGVDMAYKVGGALAESPRPILSPREIFLLKRSTGKHGKGLGKTTGWIHRASLAMKKVKMLSQVEYLQIDNNGLLIAINGEQRLLEVDNIIICAGQVSLNPMAEQLKNAELSTHIIGGADIAAELDAKKAINQASYLAAEL